MKHLLALLLLAAAPFAGAQEVPEPEGYRQDAYRAPVPATLSGALVVDTDAAHALWTTGRVAFIDVLPHAPKPANLPEGTFWREAPHRSIEGAVWLPNVGYGQLADVVDGYFRAGLETLTGGDRDHPVLFFCLPDCWMSWNAARRAITEYGYRRVYWYPDGVDGWAAAGLPVVADLRPEPGGG